MYHENYIEPWEGVNVILQICGRETVSILVSCLSCCLIQDPNFSLRAAILLAASEGSRYIYVFLV